MYKSHFEMVYNQISEGIKISVNDREENVVMTEIILRKGAVFPEHIHLSDHSGYLLRGRICITSDGIPSIFSRGDSWCIGKKITHYTEALEDSVVIDVYSQEEEEFEKRHSLEETGIAF